VQAQHVDATQLARGPCVSRTVIAVICGQCEMPTRLLHEKELSTEKIFFYGQV
jgi:hypothetical protein